MINFHELKIWQRSVALSITIARDTKGRGRYGPRGLVSQLTRSIDAVHSNIAEGCGYDSPQKTAHSLSIAIGELNECESHLTEAAALGVLQGNVVEGFVLEVQALRRMTLKYRRWILRNED